MTGREVEKVYRYLLGKQALGEGLVWSKSSEMQLNAGSSSGEGKGKAREATELDDEERGEETENRTDNGIVQGGNRRDDKSESDVEIGKVEGTAGTSKKRRVHRMSDVPSAKKQRKMIVDVTERSTRYGALHAPCFQNLFLVSTRSTAEAGMTAQQAKKRAGKKGKR